MTNFPVETYWSVDGISLQTYAMNITTLGGSRGAVPKMRGDNSTVAYRRGSLWSPKVPDESSLTLLMWVRSSDSMGALPLGAVAKDAKITQNLRALRSLFWRPDGSQVNLTKRWYESAGAEVYEATAKVELVGTLEPTYSGPHKLAVAVELKLADPFFYATAVDEEVPVSEDPWTNFVGAGDTVTNRVVVELFGPLQNPKLTLAEPILDIWVSLGTTIADGDSIVLDCDMYTAIRQSDGANLIGTVSHSGSRQWMKVLNGPNTFQLISDDEGEGYAVITYHPAYL